MADHSPNASEPQEEVFISWTSPSRVFKKRDKEYFTNIGAIVFLLVIILVFAREFMLIAAVLGIVFFVYALATVPPEDIKHKISNFGIETGGKLYRWNELTDFWFEEQWHQTMLVVRRPLSPRLLLLVPHEEKEKVKDIVASHIPFREEPDKGWVDNAASWLSQKVPLEKPS